MRVPSAVTDQIDWATVVRGELIARNRFMPPRHEDLALVEHSEELSTWMLALTRQEFEADPNDTVMARKSRSGSRPMTYMTLKDRLLLRGVASTIESPLSIRDRRAEAYDSFVKAPLADESARYVLKADVAAFYQYVDHERLVDEVIAQTGDDISVSLAVLLLQGASQRKFGLPQMTDASDTLAELYIEPVLRELLRSEFSAARFADDFRVGCADYNEALGALEVTERAVHRIGLVLNESKTSTWGRDRYRESLDEVEEAEAAIFAWLDVQDFFNLDLGYDDAAPDGDRTVSGLGGAGIGQDHDEIDPSDAEESFSDTHEAAAKLVIDLWAGEADADEIGVQWTPSTEAALLKKAIYVLTRTQNPYCLQHVTALLVREPHLTPQVCNYMVELIPHSQPRVTQMINTVCERRIVSVWQGIWISHVAANLPRASRTRASVHSNWLREQTTSEHPALAAAATTALARRRMIRAEEVVSVYNSAPRAHRPSLLMALAAVVSDEARARGLADDQVGRWQAEWAAERWGS